MGADDMIKPAAAIHQERVGAENREAVRKWFQDHLCGTQRECAAALGINVCVVGRHVKSIRAEWRK